MAEIPANSVNDISSRGATNTTLAQFKGKPRQLIVNIDDGYRPVIMDGSTLGGKFKVASVDEVNAVKTTANNALTKAQGDSYYLGKTANAVSASKLATARTIALSGAVTGTATSFDGSANISIPVTSVDATKVTGVLSVNTTGNANTATTANTALACSGNSVTATKAELADKATADSAGNNIVNTYATKSQLSSATDSISTLTTNLSTTNGKVTTLESDVSSINSSLSDYFPVAGGTITGDTTVQGNFEATGVITATAVYNAVYNDYAELFPRDISTVTEEGDIIALDTSSNIEKYKKAVTGDVVVGIHSESYGHILGGKANKTLEDNLVDHIPIALVGRVPVKVKGTVNLGDYIIPSDEPGIGIATTKYQDTAVGRVISYPITDAKVKLVRVKVI